MRRPEAVPAVAVALALVLGAALTTVGVRRLGADQGGSTGRGASTGPTAPVQVPPPAGVPTTPDVPVAPDVLAALEERIRPLDNGTPRLDDAENGLGPLDADGVVARAGGSEADRAAARRELELLGFQHALGRGWRSPRGRVLVVLAHRFATPQGAQALVDGLRAQPDATVYRSRAVPGAVAYTAQRDGRLEQRAVFARGPYVYEVTYSTPFQDEGDAVFESLLGRQAAHAARLDP